MSNTEHKRILCLCQSNRFTVQAVLSLHERYAVERFHLRHPILSGAEHFQHQLQMYQEFLYFKRGLLSSPYPFSFHDVFLHRLTEALTSSYDLLFVEVVTFDLATFSLLEQLTETVSTPILLYMKNESLPSDHRRHVLKRLEKLNIRHIVTDLQPYLLNHVLAQHFFDKKE